MSARLQELAWQQTSMGDLTLRRRRDPALDVDVYEVKLGDEFLMSSLFSVAERQLATLGLAAASGQALDVVVGGLGLGFTAHTALADPRVTRLTVVDALAEVIDWHRRDLVPRGRQLTDDPRVRLAHGDFFAAVASGAGFHPDEPDSLLDAVLLDVDHSPRHVLHPSHADFYTPRGTARLARLLVPGGVFALWSDDPPDEEYLQVLDGVFASSSAHVVTFANPLTAGESSNTVYLGVV